MLQTLRITGKKFSSKTGGVGGCNLQISRRTPSLVIPHFEGLKMKKPTGGKNILGFVPFTVDLMCVFIKESQPIITIILVIQITDFVHIILSDF